MAKKKFNETAEEQVEAPDVTVQEAEIEKPEEVEKVTADKIPQQALEYLKRHEDVKEVYIDKLGGVFHSDTPKVFVKDAVLYQNPYFK